MTTLITRAALAVALALSISFPLSAQTQTVGYSGSYATTSAGQLTTGGDTVWTALSGGAWATAKFTATTAGSATVTAQVSIDGGFNYFASAYAKRLSTIAANPTIQGISATTLTTGDVWEVSLPANSTHFRLLCGGSGSTTTVTLWGGTPYTPGTPVTAVLAQVTTGVGSAYDSGILDTSGWSTVGVLWSPGGGVAGSISAAPIADNGGQIGGFAGAGKATGAGTESIVLSRSGMAGQNGTAPNGPTAFNYLTRRTEVLGGATAAQANTVRIEASR